MIALVTALIFAGYTLVYAAVANGGALATRPWDALRMSAYPNDDTGAGGAIGGAIGKALGR